MINLSWYIDPKLRSFVTDIIDNEEPTMYEMIDDFEENNQSSYIEVENTVENIDDGQVSGYMEVQPFVAEENVSAFIYTEMNASQKPIYAMQCNVIFIFFGRGIYKSSRFAWQSL